jgi:ABC-type bacteriocin/lantibiotic exporter with double-glycine peptidase domain
VPTSVPFFSQFFDISKLEWQKVGCGIASLAMVIDYHDPGVVDVDTLLDAGIEADAFLENAGWTHAGLIALARPYGLTGSTHSLAGSDNTEALAALAEVVSERPVIVSVHYTFDPQNPIPHLVVITDIEDGLVYYNDPADTLGGNHISAEKFTRAWKKRYIDIRPVS